MNTTNLEHAHRNDSKPSTQRHGVPIALLGGIAAISVAFTALVTFGFFERQAIPSEARLLCGHLA